ncbi:hypothetical protein L1049_024229 [Liquidambar formosana]|uniref:Uncharacterized protein n=1 Tax=Liquidambar formosana TaxID=63359 RepID=A0AAP0RUI8_LIQFO
MEVLEKGEKYDSYPYFKKELLYLKKTYSKLRQYPTPEVYTELYCKGSILIDCWRNLRVNYQLAIEVAETLLECAEKRLVKYIKEYQISIDNIAPIEEEANPPIHVLLDLATTHVKHLQERIEELKQTKELLKGDNNRTQKRTRGAIAPVINLRNFESALEVNLIIGPDKKFMLHELISALEEEGAEVISASHCTLGDKISYTIHSQAISARIGIEPSGVDERLKKLIP